MDEQTPKPLKNWGPCRHCGQPVMAEKRPPAKQHWYCSDACREQSGGRKSLHLTLRIPPSLADQIGDAISRANATATTKSRAEPYSIREWVTKAITEKLAHSKRRRLQLDRKLLRKLGVLPAEPPQQESVQNANGGTGVADSFFDKLVVSDGVAHDGTDPAFATEREPALAGES